MTCVLSPGRCILGRPRSRGLATVFGRYLAVKEISYADAAADLEVHPRYANMLASGAVTPGLKLALKIAKWSKRLVPVDSWRKKEPLKKRSP